MISRTHKIRLIPNKTQETFLRQSCGCARYAYNWAVATWNEQYRNGEKPNAYAIKKEWTKNKPEWAYDVPKDASLNAILNLGKGFDAFFKGIAEHPHFHKKGVHESFTVNNDKFSLDGNRIRLPKIGWIRMRESLRFEGKISSATVSCEAGQWHISIPVQMEGDIQPPNDSVVGVDVGIKTLAIASDETVCLNDKQFTKYAKKLKRLQRHLSRKQKKSHNRMKALRRLQKFNMRLKNRRNDAIHKFTSGLAKSHGTAVIETLDVQSMGKDKEQKATKELKWLRCLLQDTAMKEVHRQLEYKMSKVEHAPKFYASSKTCSRCGHKVDTLGMDVRTYKCEECGLMIDRDLNAAINLSLMRWATPSKPAESRKDYETGSEKYIRVHIA